MIDLPETISLGGSDHPKIVRRETVFNIARVCHEANRAYCVGLGDSSQLSWDESPEWQTDSAINGVLMHLKNKDASCRQSHESWMSEKLKAGWKYGATKNVDEKSHPCLLPYDELPYAQRLKDALFKSIVDVLRPN